MSFEGFSSVKNRSGSCMENAFLRQQYRSHVDRKKQGPIIESLLSGAVGYVVWQKILQKSVSFTQGKNRIAWAFGGLCACIYFFTHSNHEVKEFYRMIQGKNSVRIINCIHRGFDLSKYIPTETGESIKALDYVARHMDMQVFNYLQKVGFATRDFCVRDIEKNSDEEVKAHFWWRKSICEI